ncbi:MAG: hypothetical protein AAGA85_26315 [Bacteroidota bacterium]
MRKLCAFLLSIILLVILFGSLVVDGFHRLAHGIDSPQFRLMMQHQGDGPSVMGLFADDAVFHDHGNGYHSHGVLIGALLQSFEGGRLSILLNGAKRALLLTLTWHGVVDSHIAFSQHPLCWIVTGSNGYLEDLLCTAEMDIPTPPPKSNLS